MQGEGNRNMKENTYTLLNKFNCCRTTMVTVIIKQ